MCYVVKYVQSPVSPDVQIQAVPIEGSEWSQHLNRDVVKSHYERRRLGKPSNLILVQCFRDSNLELLHSFAPLETEETYDRPVQQAEHLVLRTSAFDPDGSTLQNKLDIYDEVLQSTEHLKGKSNRWICDFVTGGGRGVQLDVFEAVEVVYKTITGEL